MYIHTYKRTYIHICVQGGEEEGSEGALTVTVPRRRALPVTVSRVTSSSSTTTTTSASATAVIASFLGRLQQSLASVLMPVQEVEPYIYI
jgi:hypothetical protein